MLDEKNSIFNIPHSLPSNSHMTAVALRTPTGSSKIESSKLMPDYGGFLELPGTKTKQSGLRVGIPFDTDPYYVRVQSDRESSRSPEPCCRDCLVATTYLNAYNEDDDNQIVKKFSTLRAVGKTLYLDVIRSIPCQPTIPNVHHFTTYSYVPYSYRISGLKYCDDIDNYVIVKFAQGIKLIRLNSFYKIPNAIKSLDGFSDSETEVDGDNEAPTPDQSALTSIDSFAEKSELEVKDASLSKSQRWLYMASCDSRDIYVKLFDLGTSKQCYNVLTKARDDDVKIKTEQSKILHSDRKRSLRSFKPSKPTFEELHQIICDPNHLVNSIIVTSNRVSLIDPRESAISMNYADKYKILSTSPSERFRQVEFSRYNDQQLYLMSDEKLRALDKRYPSKDLNILNHMIDAINYDVMNMRLDTKENTEQETLCLSAYGDICLTSFDQSQYTHSLLPSPGNLINPRSMHIPIHEPSPTKISGRSTDELYGLSVDSRVVFDGRDILFSVLQLSQDGSICARGFPVLRDESMGADDTISIGSTSQSRVKHSSPIPQADFANPDLEVTDSNEPIVQNRIDNTSELNILDASCIADAEKLLTTKRAIAKYDWMKKG